MTDNHLLFDLLQAELMGVQGRIVGQGFQQME
jgi:hypothetical protein